ncbi:hypothetical protein HYPSUDRAFT_214767 [Hypholoma sublateritium FD-334 SS-4]|uniref:Uncharacterized protein n=1 Tax=Hypholoma sublateritium (strain FD-334 SS-4) TaxID=945553 RepID=A0A0D2L9T4_HYPSF|nr:hypothetical protein HYPSUDRAFT_214767 [Hypholoma sublateritium FD-334 SS-4]
MRTTPPGAPDQHQTHVRIKESWANLEWRHLAPFSERARTVSPWQRTIAAIAFLFPHRKREPRKHHDGIDKEFTAEVDLATHHQVILFDRAVRIIVGGGEEHLLTDLETFRDLYNAIIVKHRRTVQSPQCR